MKRNRIRTFGQPSGPDILSSLTIVSGTGLSDKPDAYTIVQPALQIDILRQLTILARDGSLAQAAKRHFANGITVPKFSNLSTLATHWALP